jgi:hypothetical protein
MIVHLVYGNDWDGMYIDGRLRHEGHRISTWLALDLVRRRGPFSLHQVRLSAKQIRRLENVGNLPSTISKLNKWDDEPTGVSP